MWPTIDRARRRLSHGTPDPCPGFGAADDGAPEREPSDEPGADTPPAVAASRIDDVVIVLGRFELDQLRVALQRALGDAVERPDTPERIERALSLLLARRDAPGRPRVLRRPAGVSTPESWEIHLDGGDQATGESVRGAGRTGRFAA
jgi:hypothetical protein